MCQLHSFFSIQTGLYSTLQVISPSNIDQIIRHSKKRIKDYTITAITEYVLKHQEYLSQLISIYIKLSYINITERHKTVNNTYVSLQKA